MEGAFGVSILLIFQNFSGRRRKEGRCLEGICVGLDQKNEEVAAKGTLNEDRILCEMVCEFVGFWDLWCMNECFFVSSNFYVDYTGNIILLRALKAKSEGSEVSSNTKSLESLVHTLIIFSCNS